MKRLVYLTDPLDGHGLLAHIEARDGDDLLARAWPAKIHPIWWVWLKASDQQYIVENKEAAERVLQEEIER